MAGQVHVDGEAWELQGCGDGCYIWIGQTNNWPDEENLPFPDKKDSQEQPNIEQLVVIVFLVNLMEALMLIIEGSRRGRQHDNCYLQCDDLVHSRLWRFVRFSD